jgi:hypothetical protein
LLCRFDYFRLHWILLDIRFRLPELLRISDPPIVEATMPDAEGLWLLDSDSVRRTALNHLNRFFNRCIVSRRKKYVQMFRHQHKGVQFVKAAITARNNLLDDNVCQNTVDENCVSFSGVRRHKVDTGLPYTMRDFRHIHTARG